MSPQLTAIQKVLKANANPGAVAAQGKFVPGVKKVYGVYTPVLNELAKRYKEHGLDIVEELWTAGALEEKIIAIKIMEKIAKKDAERSLKLVQRFAIEIDNWAVCDAVGMQALKSLVKTHTKEIFSLANKFNLSKNLWQKRLSLVLIEWYTRNSLYHTEINKLVKNLENDKEYYVKKAVEWIKRNMAKGK